MNAAEIECALGRNLQFLEEPLPKAKSVKQAHDAGRSVWMLPRSGDALDGAVERLTTTLTRRSSGGGDASGWLATATGNPHTYDAPDAQRTGACMRVLPTTYAQLQQVQRKLGLRTTAGAWEFLLRLGFAVAERLPA
jgi:hypothetical protein